MSPRGFPRSFSGWHRCRIRSESVAHQWSMVQTVPLVRSARWFDTGVDLAQHSLDPALREDAPGPSDVRKDPGKSGWSDATSPARQPNKGLFLYQTRVRYRRRGWRGSRSGRHRSGLGCPPETATLSMRRRAVEVRGRFDSPLRLCVRGRGFRGMALRHGLGACELHSQVLASGMAAMPRRATDQPRCDGMLHPSGLVPVWLRDDLNVGFGQVTSRALRPLDTDGDAGAVSPDGGPTGVWR